MTEENKVPVLSDLDDSREAGNNWFFNGSKVVKYIANGTTVIEAAIIDRETREETDVILRHYFEWKDDEAYAEYENSFVTTMRRVCRSADQTIKTAHTETINAALYENLVTAGVMCLPTGNGQYEEIEKSREDMLEFARLYPASASEVIEAWIESANFKLVDESKGSFDWLFTAETVKKVEWWIGDYNQPYAAGILTFKSPTKEARKAFDEDVQIVKTKRQGEQNIAHLSESYQKKLQYGLTHLLNVEGVDVKESGHKFNENTKKEFVVNFNPIWFNIAMEKVHESFSFMKGKSSKN